MQLLVSNDDGIFSLGVRTLANTLSAAGHHVTVVCPNRERSATGHSLTLHQPIRAELVEIDSVGWAMAAIAFDIATVDRKSAVAHRVPGFE